MPAVGVSRSVVLASHSSTGASNSGTIESTIVTPSHTGGANMPGKEARFGLKNTGVSSATYGKLYLHLFGGS